MRIKPSSDRGPEGTPIAVERERVRETDFIVERYHRAFDDELVIIRSLVRTTCGATATLGRVLAQLDVRLKMHALLQEMRLFPAFEANGRRDTSMLEACAQDALKLFDAVNAVRFAFSAIDVPALRSRVTHIIDEIQDHLSVEVRVLAPWTGRSPS